MRGLLLAGVAVVTALSVMPAMASSVSVLRGVPATTPSVTAMGCGTCPNFQPEARVSTYVVPELAPGTDRSELKDINGEMKIVREEAWLGGSPVTFISKASADDLRIARAAQTAPLVATAAAKASGTDAARAEIAVNVSVDTALTTAALTKPTVAAAADPLAKSESLSHDFDGQDFQLRLD